MNTKNSGAKTTWIDTSMHRVTLAEYEADFVYPCETLDQGRSATNPVPRVSMYAGKPIGQVNKTALVFWAAYWSAIGLAVSAGLLACFPH